mmetsp:Transcript_4424/g.12755  ORF Transcript_4424/g.12755 Transcript_4424/m.12755 type:complete len:175 (-) Transcript_4424:154-678(-)|eukprot:CAMPEP_0206137042 /NCGR_PEP_ID=MMETSP1473-20131121/2229_1 /ASSEMBLY_ACC=CAM_ASM_001109 /TAXON_ID=1461547 /ORGANISM="Stichococcus sp, Strain RCC1054" /LENGTH=174 /DNA_ID=CAMNT_0053529937 /DNA_START=206 /DNA_END=730 /DNA_ORIENTATION=-
MARGDNAKGGDAPGKAAKGSGKEGKGGFLGFGKKKPEPEPKSQVGKPEEEVIGSYRYNWKDRMVPDYVREATRHNMWYYRDRCNVARGPCGLPTLRDCWVHGVIDENTLVWGEGLIDWLPIRNVRTLVAQIRIVEVQAATWVKKQFGLKPAIRDIRRHRPEYRRLHTDQIDEMY